MTDAHPSLGRHARAGAWGTLALAALVSMAPTAAAGAAAATRAHPTVRTPGAPTNGASGTFASAGGSLVVANPQLISIGLDVVAILVLVFGLYLRRHHRRDLVVAFLGVNVGVMAVSGGPARQRGRRAGLGLGLFGVLSIIRLRSDELAQHEVAYYFSAPGPRPARRRCSVNPAWLGATLMAAILLALWVGDNPRLLSRSRAS